jgi:hypothetical protein
MMWRPWTKIRWTIRLSTLILLTLVAGLSIALYVQHEREKQLVSALRFARHFNEEALTSALDKPFTMAVPPTGRTTLVGLLRYVRTESITGYLWNGAPIFVDPDGLKEVGQTQNALIVVPTTGASIKTVLTTELGKLKLGYVVKDGILTITSRDAIDKSQAPDGGLD